MIRICKEKETLTTFIFCYNSMYQTIVQLKKTIIRLCHNIPIQRPPRPPPFGVWESVPTIKRPEECKSCWPLQLIMLSTVGSPYPDFQKTRPRLLCFVNRTNHIRNLGGLVIQKTKPNPVFFRITRPFLNISERVSISGQIQVNWDEFRIKRPPRWIRFETPLYFFNLNTSVLNVGSCMPRD